MHQNLIRIIKISALTFILSTWTLDLILYQLFYVISWNFELLRVLLEICIVIDTFFLFFHEYFTEVLNSGF